MVERATRHQAQNNRPLLLLSQPQGTQFAQPISIGQRPLQSGQLALGLQYLHPELAKPGLRLRGVRHYEAQMAKGVRDVRGRQRRVRRHIRQHGYELEQALGAVLLGRERGTVGE